MRFHLVLLSAVLVSASHDSWSCTDPQYFPQTCFIAGPPGTNTHLAGAVTLGGASSNASAANYGVPKLACIISRGTYSFIPQNIIAAGTYRFCRDIGEPGFTWIDTANPDTLLFANAGAGLKEECERLGKTTLHYLTNPDVKGILSTNQSVTPWIPEYADWQAVTSSCPRIGGPEGRGGTPAGFATFLEESAYYQSLMTVPTVPEVIKSTDTKIGINEEDIKMANIQIAMNKDDIKDLYVVAYSGVGVAALALVLALIALVVASKAGEKAAKGGDDVKITTVSNAS